MTKRIFFLAILLSGFISTSFSQTQTTPKSFTQEDWDKLSQPERDSINKAIRKKFEAAKLNNEAIAENNAEGIIADALRDRLGTKSLTFTDYPRTYLPKEFMEFLNLEEFTCLKCTELDLNILFNQLYPMSKLKRVNISGGGFRVIPNSIKKLFVVEELILKDNNFVTLPDSFVEMKRLRVLNLEHNPYLYDEDVFERIKTMGVEELNFSASGLLELNDKIGAVKSLKKLDLSVNDIKVLPPPFNQLTNLRQINLSQNFNLDVEKVVASISPLPGLTDLDLSQCLIKNLPLDISKLSSLKKLNLKANQLTSLPLTFGLLSGLEYLDLGYLEMGLRMNKITDLGPAFTGLKQLRYLNLAGNQLSALPEGFGAFTELEELNLNLNKLKNFPAALTGLTKLKHLDLGLNEGSSLPATIGNLAQLEYLNLDGNFFTKPDKKIKTLPIEICNLKNLKTLSVKDNVIETLPDCIGSLTKLEKLDLRDNLISSFGAGFTQLKNLKWLDLKANDFEVLPNDFQNLTSLKELNLSMNPKIKYAAEKEKLSALKGIELLDLSYNNITKEEITPLREALPNAKVINWDYSKTTLPQPEKRRNAK